MWPTRAMFSRISVSCSRLTVFVAALMCGSPLCGCGENFSGRGVQRTVTHGCRPVASVFESSRKQPAVVHREAYGFGPGPGAGLADRRRQVVAHRALGQAQGAGDVGD